MYWESVTPALEVTLPLTWRGPMRVTGLVDFIGPDWGIFAPGPGGGTQLSVRQCEQGLF